MSRGAARGPAGAEAGPAAVVCVDVGSTWTKAAVVELAGGRLLGSAAHPTTTGGDVLDGVQAAVSAAATACTGSDGGAPVLVCSSAGGGLRLAVVGHEPLVTAQAGHRVGLSAGARVVQVRGGRLDAHGWAELLAAAPDVILLVGGTDGGDEQVLLHNAAWLAGGAGRAPAGVPVVVAGNVEASGRVGALLAGAGVEVAVTGNVLPRIGQLCPGPARAAIREVFLRHVIGGKGLSARPAFVELVRGATPDAVLTGVELLAAAVDGDLLVVDVGGATTDVYSVCEPQPGQPAEVAGTPWQARTVEGDLGLRAGAAGLVAAATSERLLADGERAELAAAAAARVADPGYLPGDERQAAVDRRLAGLAVTVALRRHARGQPVGAGGVRRGGRDLRRVALVVGSGGVLRHAPAELAGQVLAGALGDHGGGWVPPARARVRVDGRYVLAAAGLLAEGHPGAARRLLARYLLR